MADFTLHTLESAPEESQALLEDSRKGFGRVPGLHAVMADAIAKKPHRDAQETVYEQH